MQDTLALEVPDLSTLPSLAMSERRHLPACGGVYFVLNASQTVMYIGSSGHLLNRWMTHHRLIDFLAHDGMRVAFLRIDNRLHRLALEHYCIDVLVPAWNNAPVPDPIDRRGRVCKKIIIRVPHELYASLEAIATSEMRSMPHQILFSLKESLILKKKVQAFEQAEKKREHMKKKRFARTKAPQGETRQLSFL